MQAREVHDLWDGVGGAVGRVDGVEPQRLCQHSRLEHLPKGQCLRCSVFQEGLDAGGEGLTG
eukprot:272784-Chlamydomonas_euryale.AAC.1